MTFANLSPTQIVFLAVVILTTLFLLLRTSRYFSRPKSPSPSWSSIARKPREPAAHRSASQETADWQVEMHEFVREIKAELDSKMRSLQAITAEADRAAARLEAALRASANPAFPREGDTLAEPKHAMPTPFAAAVGRNRRPPEFVSSVPNFRETAAEPSPGVDLSNLPMSQAESLRPARVLSPEHSSAQTKKEEIHTLADYGLSAAEIAARVGHPLGEVELILNLRGKG